MNEFGLKELYDVTLKATYPIEIGNRIIEAGETVVAFDKIQIATFQENKKFTSSGNNTAMVWWEETKDITFNLSQGVFSKAQLALLTNAKLAKSEGVEEIKLNCREILESDDKGRVITRNFIEPPYFVYLHPTGEKITGLSFSGKTLFTGTAFQEYLVDYCYNYYNGYEVLSIGNPLISGYLSLEGKTRVKDDITGQVKTGIIRIPKLKLLSNLSIRLGNDAIPQVGHLDAVAVPTGARGQKKIMELIFLNDDIDSDM